MMNGDLMADEVLSAIDAAVEDIRSAHDARAARDVAFKAMCNAIVAHITTNAVVAVTGVQNGSGTAPGTVS